MGKLIKNHWARLIILAAGTCMWQFASFHHMFHKHLTNTSHRPSRSRTRGLLLAQDLLGFPHKNPRCRRQAGTDTANHQPPLRTLTHRLGVAARFYCRIQLSPQSRGPPGHPSAYRPGCRAHLPRDKRCDLPGDWTGCVLLGIQRGRG